MSYDEYKLKYRQVADKLYTEYKANFKVEEGVDYDEYTDKYKAVANKLFDEYKAKYKAMVGWVKGVKLGAKNKMFPALHVFAPSSFKAVNAMITLDKDIASANKAFADHQKTFFEKQNVDKACDYHAVSYYYGSNSDDKVFAESMGEKYKDCNDDADTDLEPELDYEVTVEC
jgi:hypothetical protein